MKYRSLPLVLVASLLFGCTIFGDTGGVGLGDASVPKDGDSTSDGGPRDANRPDAGPPDLVQDAAPDIDWGADLDWGWLDLDLDFRDEGPGDAADGGAGDMADLVDMPDMPACTFELIVAVLEPSWTTPNTARLRWDWVRTDIPVESFELVVGKSQADVMNRTNVTVFTELENRELGLTSDARRVGWTSAWGLDADTTYYAQLVAVNAAGCRSGSAVATFATRPDATDEHVVFSEAALSGFPIPPSLVLSNRMPQAGLFHYEWLVDCAGGCFELVRHGGLNQTVSGFDVAKFDDAFIEYWLFNEGTSFADYPVARIGIDSGAGTVFYKREGVVWNAPSNGYRLYQLPLRLLQDFSGASRPLMSADVLVGATFNEFAAGLMCEQGSRVGWDEVRVRW